MKFILIQFHITFKIVVKHDIHFTLCSKSMFFVMRVHGEHETPLAGGGSWWMTFNRDSKHIVRKLLSNVFRDDSA